MELVIIGLYGLEAMTIMIYFVFFQLYTSGLLMGEECNYYSLMNVALNNYMNFC